MIARIYQKRTNAMKATRLKRLRLRPRLTANGWRTEGDKAEVGPGATETDKADLGLGATETDKAEVGPGATETDKAEVGPGATEWDKA